MLTDAAANYEAIGSDVAHRLVVRACELRGPQASPVEIIADLLAMPTPLLLRGVWPWIADELRSMATEA